MRTSSKIPTIYIWLCLSELFSIPYAYADIDQANTGRITEVAAFYQVVDIELDFSGSIRETRLTSIDLSLREKLSDQIDGALMIGHLLVDQGVNPIPAGQDTKGGYLGLDIRGHVIRTEPYSMLVILHYRYTMTEQSTNVQTVEWDWHELGLSIDNQITINNNLSTHIAISTSIIDGTERATGSLDQRIDFKQKDNLTGHIGLQLNLDAKGKIGFDVLVGSTQGGRFIFTRDF